MSSRHSLESSPDDRSKALGHDAADLSQPARRLDSATLFGGEHEIGIEHRGSLYRLKITRQGKLILNK